MALASGAYFTHQGAETIFCELADDIDRFSTEYAVYADRAWEKLGNGA
jgi:hypothetical protein